MKKFLWCWLLWCSIWAGQAVAQEPVAKSYHGKPISLHFKNVEVRTLLQAIADFTGKNIVVSEGVTGTMSIKLKKVPWDQALDMVLASKGLAMRQHGAMLWIAPYAEWLEREKQQRESNLATEGLVPVRTQVFALNYAKATELVKPLVGQGEGAARILSKRGSAFAEARTNQLFVTDVPDVLQRVGTLLHQLDIPVRQVLIEARIVEANANWGKSLGAKLSLLGQQGAKLSLLGQQGANNAPFKVGLTAAADGQNATPLYQLPASGVNGMPAATLGLSLFTPWASRILALEISALEGNGQGQLLASPSIVTSDQNRALVEQGTELPYQVTGANGSTSMEFRKANLKLEVTPRITPEGKVLLDLNLAKDSVGRATTQGYAIDTKHVQTQVLVEDGGTLVIGGIYETAQRHDVTKVPVLGDIPILGGLFKQRTQMQEKREMLVFITPKILAEHSTSKEVVP